MEYTVYAHKNLKNDKYYIGMTSLEPKRRWDSGWGYKNNSQMWNDIQNSDWNKDWVHGILGKFTDKNEALKYEAFLIAMLDSANNGYNSSSYGNSHFKHSEESKKKVSEAMTGEKNHWYGKHHTEETKRKISESLERRIFSEDTKKKMSEAKTGKHRSEDTKNRISSSMGVNGILQYSRDGIFIAEYPSIMEASRQTGCHNQNICSCCKGKYKTCGGFIWKYKEGI